jgi:hypothetical protein
MAPSDISLSRVAHNPHAPLRTTAPIPSPAAPATSAPAPTAPSFSAVFSSITAGGTTAATTAPAAPATPVAASPTPADEPAAPLFGANPWLTDPTCSGPGPAAQYNPVYFATAATAQTVAQMVGGTVTSTQEFTSAPGSPYQQDQPNLMVQLPNGGLINPGLIADIYAHGWSLSFENQQVASEVAGAAPASTNG